MSRLTTILGIRHPIVQGGMGNISNASLASAVSNAGGLGMIGAGTMAPDEVESIILETKKRTEKPFGVNIAISVSPYVNEIVDLIIKHEVAAVSLSAGKPDPLIPILKEHDIKILCVVASVAHAKKAERAGVDIIIGEGYEAAGINSHLETTTFTLIPQLVHATTLPVIAAGGIGDGRGLAAALALGASGVQMGTRFIATKESAMHDEYISAVLRSTDHSTLIVGRSLNKIRRVLPTPYIKQVIQKEKEGFTLDQYADLTSEVHHVKAAVEGKLTEGFINGGQIAGLIEDVPTVHQLITRMISEAKHQLEKGHLLLNE